MLPSAIDDEHLDLCSGKIGSQPVASPSLLECYIQAVQLQEILGHILTQLYYGTVSGKQEQIITDFPLNQTKEQVGNNRGGNTDLQQILKIDKILVAWHSKLPTHLKLENYEKNLEFVSADTHKQAIFYRQSTVLEMR